MMCLMHVLVKSGTQVLVIGWRALKPNGASKLHWQGRMQDSGAWPSRGASGHGGPVSLRQCKGAEDSALVAVICCQRVLGIGKGVKTHHSTSTCAALGAPLPPFPVVILTASVAETPFKRWSMKRDTVDVEAWNKRSRWCQAHHSILPA
jgi:hypothetical protein